VEAYIQRVNSVAVLSEEEEFQLARQLHDHGDLAAAQQLILAHLRYVVRVARGYMGYGLPIADLIQEGTIGLMKAVKRFDPYKEVRLVSFAVHWIKSEIHDYVIKNWRIVKVATTKAQRKLFFNLRRAKQRLGWFTQEEINAVATDLGVKPEEVLEMESRLNAHDMAFDAPSEDESEYPSLPAPEHFLKDETDNPVERLQMLHDEKVLNVRLTNAMQKLDARSQNILAQRWLNDEKATLNDLASQYKVSAERIRQLEVNAMKKLRETMADEL